MQKSLLRLTGGLLFVGSLIPFQLDTFASSHGEAPFVTEHPKVDGTDLYMFNSYETGRSDYVTFIANYNPLQNAGNGPNYYKLDPKAYYDINIDNAGDANPEMTFRFQFRNIAKNLKIPVGDKMVAVPLNNIGAISAGNSSALNVDEDYTVSLITKSGTKLLSDVSTGKKRFGKPSDYAGTKSFPDYSGYAAQFIYNVKIPGCATSGKVFVGQRQEGFAVNLGKVFDLVNLNPLGTANSTTNPIGTDNITSMALEVPKACLTHGTNPTIGAWTTASLPRSRVLLDAPTYRIPDVQSGAYVEVSRLGSPLVNELVIGLKDKDRWNASKPIDDAQFLTYVTNPTVPALLQILFPAVTAPTQFPRTDLVEIFITGITGLNKTKSVGEMERLNTSIPAIPAATQSSLGVIAGDNAGYPNGRRPGDDVVDITLRAAMGVLLPANVAPSGQLPYNDGVAIAATDFQQSFPYLNTPIAGNVGTF